MLDIDADKRVDGVANIGGRASDDTASGVRTSFTSIETIATRMSPLLR